MFANLSGTNLVFVLVSILISLSIHEAMHAYTAHWLGDTTASDLGTFDAQPAETYRCCYNSPAAYGVIASWIAAVLCRQTSAV